LPLAAVALAVLGRWVPDSQDQRADDRINLLGAGAAASGLACINYALIEAPAFAERPWPIIFALASGLSSYLLFLILDARHPNPLLPLELFRSRTFKGANLLTLCLFTALNGMLFFLPLNLIQIQGYNPLLAALSQAPVMVFLIAL